MGKLIFGVVLLAAGISILNDFFSAGDFPRRRGIIGCESRPAGPDCCGFGVRVIRAKVTNGGQRLCSSESKVLC